MPQKYIIELEAKADKAIEGIDELKKEIKRLNEAVVSSNKDTTDGIKNVEKATKGTTKQLRNLGAAIKKVGLGLLIASWQKVQEIFKSSQPVVDLVNTSFEFLGLLFKDFVDFVSNKWDSGTKPIRDFFAKEGVQKGVKAVSNFMLELITRLKNVIQGLGGFASAFGKLITGDFSGAMMTAQTAVENFTDAVVGNEEETQAVKEAIVGATTAISNYVKNTVAAARANVELNKQAEVARVLQQGLIETYDRQAEKLRQIRDDERNTLGERIQANNELKAVLDEQEKAMLKQVDLQVKSAQAQYDKNQNQENYIALLEATQEREAVLAQIEGFRSEQLANDLALSREAFELQLSLRQGYVDRAVAENEFNASFIQGEVARLEATRRAVQEERRLREELLRDNLARTKLGTQAQVDATNELFDFLQQTAQKEKELDRQITQAKLATVSQSLGQIANLLGENSKFGKALAVTQAVIDTYAGANKALAQGGIFGVVAAAGVIATGIANVRQIVSTQEPSTPSFATGGGGVSNNVPSPPPAPPAFNVVGAAAGNQLAEAIAGQQNKPMKAYVVSREVTSAQELDRNAVRDASI